MPKADLLDLTGRSVVVAGAGGGGIGTAICRMIATAGGTVIGLDIDDRALATAADVVTASAPHQWLVADVRDPTAVERAVDQAAAGGNLHGLVHVAGGLLGRWSPILDTDPAVFDDILDLNLRAAFLTNRAVARRLPNGGSIVNIASLAGLSGLPFGAGYAAAKAALMALTRTAALEWGRHQVRVNAVAVGTIRTPRAGTVGVPDSAAERAVLPLGRTGRPDDIAGAVVFLLSDLSEWITGQTLAVDGGSSVRPSFLGADDYPVFVRQREEAPG